MTFAVYDRYNFPPSKGLVSPPGLTQNEHARECDINLIMEKYLRTGTVAQRADMGRFGDFSEAGDFHEAQNVLVKARGQFAALSSKVRERFQNDPGRFLAWVHDPARKSADFDEVGLDMSAEYVSARDAAKAAAGVPPKEGAPVSK